jgi:AcrR family transcriptional regulator
MDEMGTERSSYHHGDLKNALVDAAVRLIEVKGVDGLSLRGVAREAGVSQAAPYHHFKDKEALVAEVCCVGFCELEARMRAAVEGCDHAMDCLEAMGRAYVAYAMEHKAYFAIMWGGYV